MIETIPEGFHRMPDGSIMADEDHIDEYKKGGKVRKRCPKGKRRSKKTGKCVKVKKTRSRSLATIPERRGSFRPSGTTGTLTADKAFQFGSGKMATEARIARLQNLVDTQSSNLSHAALQKHLVALGYKPVPELQREQRYLGDIVDSTGARFAGAPGGDDGNYINESPFAADRNRLRLQRKWEQGQPITRGELRRALHDDAWEGENIRYVPRDDDLTFADEEFLGSYGQGQYLFDDMGLVDDIENARQRQLRRGGRQQRSPTGGGGAYGGPAGFARGATQFGGGARTERDYRYRPPPSSSGASSYTAVGGGEESSEASGRYSWSQPASSTSSESGDSGAGGLAGGLARQFTSVGRYNEPPFGQPNRSYVRGRSDEPVAVAGGLSPWQTGVPSVAETEDFSDIGTSVSGREPPRFAEQAQEVAGQAAGALGTGAINVAQTAGRLGLDLAGGGATAIYDRLPSAGQAGEFVVGGGLDLAGGAGRAMYNRLPEGPDMGRFLNDASGLVSDFGDSVRGGMRQVPGQEILGGLNDRPFDEEQGSSLGESVVAVSTPVGAESSIAGTEDLGRPEDFEGFGEEDEEPADPDAVIRAFGELEGGRPVSGFVGDLTASQFSDLAGEFYPRGGTGSETTDDYLERTRADEELFGPAVEGARLIRGRDEQPTPFRRPTASPAAGPPSSVSSRTDTADLSSVGTSELGQVEAIKEGNPDAPPEQLISATPRTFRKVEAYTGEERTPAREVSRLKNRQSLAYRRKQAEKLERQGLDASVEGIQIDGVDIDFSDIASSVSGADSEGITQSEIDAGGQEV